MLWTMATRQPAAPGSGTLLGIETHLLEEDLAMSDRMPEPGHADDQGGSEHEMSDTAEFAKMRVFRDARAGHFRVTLSGYDG